MKKENLMLLAQLLHTMKELASKIEQYHKKGDAVKLESAKREFLLLQKRVGELV
jgi:hypothetical protein|tara:strand:+ start:2928 stop:3089 length:162 start_codon:yes stop_codon:yes gene_type:complete